MELKKAFAISILVFVFGLIAAHYLLPQPQVAKNQNSTAQQQTVIIGYKKIGNCEVPIIKTANGTEEIDLNALTVCQTSKQ